MEHFGLGSFSVEENFVERERVSDREGERRGEEREEREKRRQR